MELESELLQEESQVPVYFTKETPTLLDIYDDVKVATNSDQAGSAAEGKYDSEYHVPVETSALESNQSY